MKLIIGGVSQGKRAYAAFTYQLSDQDWADGSVCSEEDLKQCKGIFNFQEWIRRHTDETTPETEIIRFAEEFYESYPERIVVSNEVGYGIVPMEAKERAWREACGRACTVLASHAEEVVRVCCGIGTKLKG